MTKRSNHLVGKGGVGLVMYHLARNGIEFTETHSSSDKGDLWVLAGKEVRIVEIKSTTSKAWNVRLPQIARSHYFAMVNLISARVWILPGDELANLIAKAYPRSAQSVVITEPMLPPGRADQWSLLKPETVSRPRLPLASAQEHVSFHLPNRAPSVKTIQRNQWVR